MRISPKRTEIAKLRCAANVLQKEMAYVVGVSVGHYQMIELGTRKSNRVTQAATEFFNRK